MRLTYLPSGSALMTITVLLLGALLSPARAADTWSAGTQAYTIPALAVGDITLTNVVLSPVTLSNVVGEPTGGLPAGTVDTYNPATNDIAVPSVTVGSAAFFNLVLSAGPLVSVGGVSGGDSYLGGGHLLLRSVQVLGGPLYTNVVISVALSNITGCNCKALPQARQDIYDLANQTLTLAAFQFPPGTVIDGLNLSNQVWTNVTLTGIGLGNVVSVGGGSIPAVYAIDSTDTLFAFDADGGKMASAALPTGSVARLAGGGITTDASNVYVTTKPSPFFSEVFAFNKNTLAAVTLPGSAFAQLNTPRGIAYDSVNSRFYVANGGAQLNVYDASGNFLSSISQSIYGPSGTAFDPLDGTVWVTNLTGGSGVNPTYGVAEFNGFGAAEPGLNPASVFQAPIAPTAELPYAITYCAPAAASGAAYLAVGFEPDNSGRGFDQGGIYTTAGAFVAGLTPALGSTVFLNAMSCTPTGQLYVAADDKLHVYSMNGSTGIGVEQKLPGSGFQSMKAPIFGVYAVPAPAALTAPPALFVIDSTDTLFSFDAAGNYLHQTPLGASVEDLNGGGLTLRQNTVYVTANAPSAHVLAFDATTLQPVTLPSGSFANMNTTRQIAYDPHDSRFYVADNNGFVWVFDANGNLVTSLATIETYLAGPAGIAFDSTNDSVWVASYPIGGTTNEVMDFTESLGIAQTINSTTQFLPPPPFTTSEYPTAIAYCPSAGVIAMVFRNTSDSGGGEGQTYVATGASAGNSYGTGFVGTMTNPHAVTCSSNGEIFVAADNGLLEFNVGGSNLGPASGAFPKLTPPIYGVFAAF